jgi:hypothetical protein
MSKNDKEFMDILCQDFEELSKGEMQILRHRTRSFFNIESSVKITPAQLLNAYLIFNRKYIKTFDTVTIITKPLKCDFGPFANGIKYRHPKLSVVTFDGLNGLKEGSFIVSEPITLPVITEFIMGEKTEIICIAPDGHFCRLKDDEFLF